MKKAILFLLLILVVVMVALPMLLDTERRVLDEAARQEAPGSFVLLSDGYVHYELAGPDSGATVVLLHGGSVPYYIWDPTFDVLVEAGFRVLRYDQYGRGYSDRPEVAYDHTLYDRQLRELLETVDVATPVHLVSLSMGGAVAVSYADTYPDGVRSLVLLDPLHDSIDISFLQTPMLGEYLMRVLVAPGLAKGQLDDFLYPDRVPDWPDRYRVQMGFEGFRRALLSTYRHFLQEDHLQRFARVGRMDNPVLLIWGREDQVLPFEGSEAVRDLLHPEFFAVDEAGHLPHLEQGAQVHPVLLEFLRRWSLPGAGEQPEDPVPEEGGEETPFGRL